MDQDRHVQAHPPPGKTLGDFCAPHQGHVTGCQVNGVFREDWQHYQPQDSDHVTFFVATEGPEFWAAVLVGVVVGLILTAASIGIAYLIKALTPEPPKPDTAGKPEQIFGLAGLTNTTALGTPKFFSYGTRRIFGHIIDTRVVVSDDGKTTNFGILYYMGEGPIQSITAIEINDIALEQFPGVTSDVRLGDGNLPLIGGFDTVASVWSDGRTLPLATPIVYQTRGTLVTRVTVILATPYLFSVDTSGKHHLAQHNYHIEIATVASGIYSDAPGPAALFTWTDNAESARFRAIGIPLPSAAQWRIRVTLMATSNQTATPPSLYNVQEEESGGLAYPTSALLALSGIASAQITSFEAMRGSALVAGRLVRQPLRVAGVWNGSSYTFAWTNNRAWVLRDLLTEVRMGLGHRIAESLWDDHAAVAVANYWDETVGGIVRDRCDLLVNDRRAAWDWIKTVLVEGRALLLPSGGLLKLVVDKADTPGLLYSQPGNILEGSVTATQGDGQGLAPNTIRGQFMDEDADYTLQILEVRAPGADTEPVRETLVTLYTLTNVAQAMWLLRYQLLRARLVQRHFTWQSPRTALVSEPLDQVSLAYETTTMARGVSGFVAAGSTPTRLLLDRLVTLAPAGSAVLLLRHQADNTVSRTTLTTPGGTWGAVVPAVALSPAPAVGDLWAIGATTTTIVPVVVESVTQDAEGNYTLVAARYEPSVHETPTPPVSPGGVNVPPERPLPLWAVQALEEVQLLNDGTAQPTLRLSVTPQLQSHAGMCRAGSTSTTVVLATTEPTPTDLVHLAGTLNGYYAEGATLTLTDGLGAGQTRDLTGYLGDTQVGTVAPAWTVTPNATTMYVITWPVFNDTTGFLVDQASVDGGGALSSAFVPLASVDGVSGAVAAPTGVSALALRFTPRSGGGVTNPTARWIVILATHGDQVGPSVPTDSPAGEGGTGGGVGDAGSNTGC